MTRTRMAAAGRYAATGAAAIGLLLTAPSPANAVDVLRNASTAPDPTRPLLAAIALIAWALVGWLLLVAAVALAARRPGTAGRVAGCLARRIAPTAIRRAVEAALGLTVAVAVLGASPASASPAVPPAPPAAAASLDWPTNPTPAATLDWNPATPPATPPAAPARHRAEAAPLSSPVAAAVVVRPGDSLWSIAAEHLPAGATTSQITRAWPTWWVTNRDAVGADPDLIHPGLRLAPPAS